MGLAWTRHATCESALTVPTLNAVPSRDGRAVALIRLAWSEHGMASVNQKRPHCVNQMGKTHSKLLAARQGNGMCAACERHAMCKSALR